MRKYLNKFRFENLSTYFLSKNTYLILTSGTNEMAPQAVFQGWKTAEPVTNLIYSSCFNTSSLDMYP